MAKRTAKKPDNTTKGQMSLSGHLRELRRRVAVCVIALVAAVLAGLRYAPDLVNRLLNIGRSYGYTFVYIAPQELLMQYVSMSLLAGLIVTIPVLLYEIWAFARPGLEKSENAMFLMAMAFGIVFFCTGVTFAYKILLPFMLYFLSSLGNGSDISAAITVENYTGFLMTVFMILGLVFELPVVSVLLTWMGFLKAGWMRKGRRVVLVLIFVMAALITPPDMVSQIMVAVPMIGLYELSIVLCALCQKFAKKKSE